MISIILHIKDMDTLAGLDIKIMLVVTTLSVNATNFYGP